MLQLNEIQIRDPFVVPAEGKYYLYGSTDKDIWHSPGVGFDVYISAGNLGCFEGPFPVFRPPENFWSVINFWAPEAHCYNGSWYLFASFKPKNGRRGTAILKSEGSGGLMGPFVPWSAGPVTPPDWECLDGTLYVDQGGKPWMVFCHEWVQVGNGEICAIPLSADLREAAGSPALLFRAADAPWAKALKRGEREGYVTDGPSLYTANDGTLVMLWSSFGDDGRYRIGAAVSETGLVTGPWRQQERPVFAEDGGHGMIFRSLEGKLYLAIHRPNTTPHERPLFLEILDHGGGVLSPAGSMIA
jgi:GH43 family beta-xylosidase